MIEAFLGGVLCIIREITPAFILRLDSLLKAEFRIYLKLILTKKHKSNNVRCILHLVTPSHNKKLGNINPMSIGSGVSHHLRPD